MSAIIVPMPISRHWIEAQIAKTKDWNVTDMSRHFTHAVRDRKVRLRGLGVPEAIVKENVLPARKAFSAVLDEAISKTTGDYRLVLDREDLKMVGAAGGGAWATKGGKT
jgi:hypothetical protein